MIIKVKMQCIGLRKIWEKTTTSNKRTSNVENGDTKSLVLKDVLPRKGYLKFNLKKVNLDISHLIPVMPVGILG